MSKIEYKHIEAWGRMLHSNPDYIWGEVQKARAENAPSDAIYWDMDKKRWITFGEVTSHETRYVMDRLLANKDYAGR